MQTGISIAEIVLLVGAIAGIIKLFIDNHNNKKTNEAKNKEVARATMEAAGAMMTELCEKQSARIAQLHADITLMEQEQDARDARLNSLERQNLDLRDDNHKLRVEITTLRAQVAEMCKENEQLKQQVSDMQESLQCSESERIELQKQVTDLSARLAKYELPPTRTTRSRATK